MSSSGFPVETSRWPHRFAVLLACATFPLIWMGGLVTTYDAGMAVVDWPGTYGYNLFLYPISTWWAGPWDLFIEHGHRLLGAITGMLAIGLVLVAWKSDDRHWFRWLTLGALGLVIVQGLLGGMRVLLEERTLALVHGCVGPLFFSLAVVMVIVTSRKWASMEPVEPTAAGKSLQRLTFLTGGLVFLQLLLGAQIRHISVMASPQQFKVWVVFHLLMVLLLVGHVGLLIRKVMTMRDIPRPIQSAAGLLSLLLLCQIGLGISTWVMKFGWPGWMGGYRFAAAYTVEAEGLLSSMVVTAHVATGSLILATSVTACLWSYRLLRQVATVALIGSAARMMGAIA